MVLDLADLAARRQQLVEMTAPPPRVFAFPVTAHGSPIEDSFDPPPQAARCLGLRLPDRLQGLHYEPDIDRLHRQGTENRARVAGQRVAPLVPMLRVPPAGVVGGDVGGGAGVEGHRLGSLQLLLAPLSTAGLDRV